MFLGLFTCKCTVCTKCSLSTQPFWPEHHTGLKRCQVAFYLTRSMSLVSPEMADLAATCGISLPPEVIRERAETKAWEARVGYQGCKNPGNPTQTARPYEPLFTVLPHVVSDQKDFSKFIQLLNRHYWSFENDPLWNPIRDYTPEERIRYGLANGKGATTTTVSTGTSTSDLACSVCCESCGEMQSKTTTAMKNRKRPLDTSSTSATTQAQALTRSVKRRSV